MNAIDKAIAAVDRAGLDIEAQRLREGVDLMRERLNEMGTTIANLRADLDEKERTIARLEGRAK